jgi:hypothetical protein
MTLTLLFVGTLYVGFVLGWASVHITSGPMIQRLKADAARWQYVRNNAEIVGEVQEGVWSWQFEAPDVHQGSFDADVDAAIAADEQRQEAWL